MPTSTSHGFPYVEPERHDELGDGVRALPLASAGGERREDGTFAKGSRSAQSAGGRATKGSTALSHRVGGLPAPLRAQAATLRRTLTGELAKSVGGGKCGVLGSLLVKFAAEATAWAEQAKAAGDADLWRKLTESARMHLVYAREHVAKEAASRPRSPAEAQADMRRRILGES